MNTDNNDNAYKTLSEINLSDVMEISLLQKFLDNFADSMNLASVAVDRNGNPVTNPSSYTRICAQYTHSTKAGDDRCAASHKKGGQEAARLGRPYIFKCHSGLIDFAAPIIVEGELIGTILGGQILTKKPNEDEFRRVAREIGNVRGRVRFLDRCSKRAPTATDFTDAVPRVHVNCVLKAVHNQGC